MDPETTVDVAPLIIDYLIPAAGGLVLAIASALGIYLKNMIQARTGVDLGLRDQQIRDYFAGIVENGVREAKRATAAADLTIEAKNVIAREAMAYAISRAPDAVAHFKLDPESVERMARAKLEELLDAGTPIVGTIEERNST